jgi:hypothetical protein
VDAIVVFITEIVSIRDESYCPWLRTSEGESKDEAAFLPGVLYAHYCIAFSSKPLQWIKPVIYPSSSHTTGEIS